MTHDEPLFRQASIVRLSEMKDGDEGDLFAQLSHKEELRTRGGKPFFKVGFRDERREVRFPVWEDSPWALECRDQWEVGEFYKLRCIYQETEYGPQLELRKVRLVNDDDHRDGFDPMMLRPKSRFDPVEMFDDLLHLAGQHIDDADTRALVRMIYEDHRDTLLTLPAATHNHHAYLGGFLEHVLSVVRTAVYLAEKYAKYYPQMDPPLDKDLVVAGAMLHDIGKTRELAETSEGAEYTPAGVLVGHILQGRDILREAAAKLPLPGDKLLRLEHIIVSHQRLPEWGSPKAPSTPEALLVHYADDIDAKYNQMFTILMNDSSDSPVTGNRNSLRQRLYRGERSDGEPRNHGEAEEG